MLQCRHLSVVDFISRPSPLSLRTFHGRFIPFLFLAIALDLRLQRSCAASMESETQFAAAEDEVVRWNASSSHSAGIVRARTGAGVGDESTPLLSGDAEDASGNRDNSWDPFSSEGREFEGKPWWKKPSVRFSSLILPLPSLTIIN